LVTTFFFFNLLLSTKDILTGHPLIYLSDFTFIEGRFLKFSFLVIALSLSGLPPFLGFFTKFFIFTGIVFINYIFLVLFFIFYSLYTSVYYLRLFKQFFFISFTSSNKRFFKENSRLDILNFIFLGLLCSGCFIHNFIFDFCGYYILCLTSF